MESKESKITQKVGTDFKIHIPYLVQQQIMFWVLEGYRAGHEVSGYCPVEYDPKNKLFTLGKSTPPFLVQQVCDASETEMDPEDIQTKMFEKRDSMAFKCHWHSHPRMGVFISGTDMDLIRQRGENGWGIYLVFNEKYEIHSAFYQLTEVMGHAHEIFVENIPVSITHAIDQDLLVAWKAEFDAHVKKAEPKVWTYDRDTWLDKRTGDLSKYRSTPTVIKHFEEAEDKELEADDSDYWPEVKIDFDVDGWGEYCDQSFYNPLRDKTVRGREEILECIERYMDWAEIDIVSQADPAFKQFANKHMEEIYARLGEDTSPPDPAMGTRAIIPLEY